MAGPDITEVRMGDPLWEPSPSRVASARLTEFASLVRERRGLEFDDYWALWEWSVDDIEGYWSSVWEYFDVQANTPYEAVLAEETMPGARWFPGATLNFAEHMLRTTGSGTAVKFRNEAGEARDLSWDELRAQVASVAAALRELGVDRGDRVVAFLPNLPETLVACLAATSLGAVWSCCSPDFGANSVVDRFAQIEPKVLIAVDGYSYNGKPQDRTAVVAELRERLTSLEQTIAISYLEPEGNPPAGAIPWSRVASREEDLQFTPVPFDHPLWILYSSGTTGPPKAILQGHGGILLGMLAAIGLQYDVGPDDTFFWFTSTGWAVWNVVVTGLLFGATIVLYDGSPTYPDPERLWQLAAETETTWFGAGTPLFLNWMRAGLRPGEANDLSRLRTVSVTGAPMPVEGFAWVYEAVGSDVWFFSVSGGTDSLVPLVAGAVTLPVRAGEIQCRVLGVNVQAFDDDGQPVVGEVGELVITRPLPSMPLRFWDDPGDARLRESYFETFPGLWRHGDWIRIAQNGSVEVLGRSDATLNRMGVRIGSGEIYSVIDRVPEIADSLVIDVSRPERQAHMILFVQPSEGTKLDDELEVRLRDTIRSELSPRHVPDEIRAVPDLPRTLNNKKMEVPVKRILLGVPLERAVNVGATQNPEALEPFIALAAEFEAERGGA